MVISITTAQNRFNDYKNRVLGYVSANRAKAIVLGSGALALGGGAVALGRSYLSNRKAKRKKTKKSRKRKTAKRTSKRTKKKKYYPHTAGKGKDRSSKRIRFTKKGQPYIIQANGRARFIKKSSAKNSRKRKGGKY